MKRTELDIKKTQYSKDSNKISLLVLGSYLNPKDTSVSLMQQHFKNEIFDIDFTCDSNKVYDALHVCNATEKEKALVYKGNVFATMGEPGFGYYSHPFMYYGLLQYDRVFSPIKESKNTTLSHGYLVLSVLLQNIPTIQNLKKSKMASFIMSGANHGPQSSNYTQRFEFRQRLQEANLDIDYFGKENNFIKNKADGLLDYHYSVAIENSSKDYYFSEKIMDCFACYTIPFYYGCTNIDTFFPSKSYVWIDITDPQRAIKTIRDTLEFDDPKDRLPYVQEARELVIQEYSLAGFYRKIFPTVMENKQRGEIKRYILKYHGDKLFIFLQRKYNRIVYQIQLFIIRVIYLILKKLKLLKFAKKILGKKASSSLP